ncbi:hypothetical protein ACFWA6_14665 [Streptomyces sp. NPDC060020]
MHGGAVLDFEVELAPGVRVDGAAAVAGAGGAFVTLIGVTAGLER